MGERLGRGGRLPPPQSLRGCPLCIVQSLLGGARGGQAAGGWALTFGLLEQGSDAVRVHGSLAQLHQRQEEGLERGVEGLQQSEAQAQALDGHVCRAQWAGVVRRGLGLASLNSLSICESLERPGHREG